MNAWQIGVDEVPPAVTNGPQFFDLSGERLYTFAYEAAAYRAGEFLVEHEESNEEGATIRVYSFSTTDPREDTKELEEVVMLSLKNRITCLLPTKMPSTASVGEPIKV